MKNITLAFTTILLAFSANTFVYGQEKSFSNIVDLGLPKSIEYLGKQKREALRTSRVKSKIDFTTSKGNIYKMGDVLLKVNASDELIQKNAYGTNKTLLEDTKKFNDEITTEIPEQKNYTSSITAIRNAKILVINYDTENAYSIFIIQAVNDRNDKTVAISVEYSKRDEAVARKIVSDLVKNMLFK